MADDEKKRALSFGAALDLITETLKPFDERAQQTMIATVCELLGIKAAVAAVVAPVTPLAPAPPGTPLATPVVVTPANLAGMDIRTLKEQKKPKSAQQMAALVAYYVKEVAPEGERKDTIKSGDLEVYFKQARYELPKKLEQVLGDGKRSGYFETTSRATYKLTRVGHNLVTHKMPAKDE